MKKSKEMAGMKGIREVVKEDSTYHEILVGRKVNERLMGIEEEE